MNGERDYAALLAENERLREVALCARAVRRARETYMRVADSQVYYDRLFAALDALAAVPEERPKPSIVEAARRADARAAVPEERP